MKLFKFLPILVCFLLASCSGNLFTYNVYPTPIVKNKTKYFINYVQADLYQKFTVSNYLTQTELEDLLKKEIQLALGDNNLMAQSLDEKNTVLVNINLDYKRKYVGEAFIESKSYANSSFNYQIEVFKDNKLLATSKNNQKKFIPTHGIADDALKSFKIISMKGGPEDEIEDVKQIAKFFAKSLSTLGS